MIYERKQLRYLLPGNYFYVKPILKIVSLCHITHHCAGPVSKSLEEEMRSKQTIQPGTLLLKEKPFVYILSSKNRTQYCDTCFKK